jgi:hypothetical protein
METRLKNLQFIVAPSARDAIDALANIHNWTEPLTIKRSGMITCEIVEGNWRYEPLIDNSTLPRGARKRIELILKSTQIAGWIIGHEIEVEPPKPLVKPLPWVVAPVPEAPTELPRRIEVDWEKVGIGLSIVGGILTAILHVVGIVLFGVAQGMSGLFCGVDPKVIAVTLEDEWIEIYHYID